MLDVLSSTGNLDQDTVKRTKQFIQENRFDQTNDDLCQKKVCTNGNCLHDL